MALLDINPNCLVGYTRIMHVDIHIDDGNNAMIADAAYENRIEKNIFAV